MPPITLTIMKGLLVITLAIVIKAFQIVIIGIGGKQSF